MFRKKKNKGVNNFDKVYYINYEHRSNRISHINDVLTNLDIDSDRIERIEGVYIKGNDALSYIKSQLAVLKDAVKNKYDNILILEDDFIAYNDFVFIDSINDLFQSNLSWDIISMCDTISSTECEYDFLVKISEANNRGGYAINKKSIKKTIAYLSEMISNDLITTPIDNIWNKLQLNWYGFKQPLGTKIIFNDDSDMIDSHILCMITTYNRRRFLEKTIDTWNKTRNKNYKWTLIIADDGSNDGTLEYLDSLKISDVEIKIIKNNRRGVHHQTNQLFKSALDMEFDFGFKCDDDLIFLKSGWDDLYINAANKTKYYHLIHYGRKHERLRSVAFGGILESYVEGKSVHGALWTFNREVLDKVGFFDLNSFNVFGFGHVDYSMRCCRMGFNNIENPYDIANSNDFVILNGEEYFSEKTGMDLWNSKEQIEEKRRILDEDRGYVEYNELDVNAEGKKIEILNKAVSFCIPAYEAQDFIEECLDSIEVQNCEKEILVGVDACQKTLDKLKEIQHKYKNLRIFYFEDNVGPYVVWNSIIKESKYNIISVFGADDIMKEDFAEECLSLLDKNSIVQVTGDNFNHPDKTKIVSTFPFRGVIVFHKDIFMDINGYFDLRCSADTDLLNRFQLLGLNIIQTKSLVLRRMHNNSLSHDNNNITGMNTEFRKKMIYLVELRKSSNIIKNDKYIFCENIEEIKSKIFFLKLKKIQCYISSSVSTFKEKLFKKYDFIDYYDDNIPAVFFGLYGPSDYIVLSNHSSKVILVWCGSDALKINEENVKILLDKKISHIAMSEFISKDLEKFKIPHKVIPVTPTDSILKPHIRGENVYVYTNGKNSNFYGQKLIDEIQKRIKYKLIIAHYNTYSKEELIDIYKSCFMGLRLTQHDGLPNTVVELGLMGRRCIYNGNLPHSISWNNVDDICENIDKEYESRNNDDVNIIHNDMKRYIDIGTDWLSELYTPYVSVAMPLYNMGKIANLAFESLCNQRTKYSWELLICEEDSENSFGYNNIISYKERLYAAGCVQIKYNKLNNWIPLGQKWKILAEMASDTKCFLLQSGDDYSHNQRIESTCDSFLNDIDFYDEQMGFFYSFRLKKTMCFNPKNVSGPTRLNMAWKTKLMKTFISDNNIKMNVDTFIYTSIESKKQLKKFRNQKLYTNGFFTDGYNNISSRDDFFSSSNNIFEETDVNIDELMPIINDFSDLELTKRMKDKKLKIKE